MAFTGVRLTFVGGFLIMTCEIFVPVSSQAVKWSSQDPQLPVTSTSQPQIPGQVEKCQVEDFERVPCGEPGVKAAQCNAINCCFDGQQCYYGKMVTVQCTVDGQFVLVVARDATVPRISLDSISMLGGNTGPCGAVDLNTAFAIYQFPVTACGTTMTVQAGYVIYENRMFSAYEVGVGPRGSITRDPYYELYFQCKYSYHSIAALAIDHSASAEMMPIIASGPLNVELRLGNGSCLSKGCLEEKIIYNSYYSGTDYPVVKVLRKPVYVEVRLLDRTDPNIVLVLEGCWATASPNPYGVPQWDLLVNGCPYNDDRYLTALIPVYPTPGIVYPNHYRRFSFRMLTFVELNSMAPQEMVYIHCSASICLPSEHDSCEPKCTSRRRDATAKGSSPHPSGMVSSGGVIFTSSSIPLFD